MGTHESERKPDEFVAEASHYPEHGPNAGLFVGVNTVHICTSTNDIKHAMVAVTIAILGFLLPSMAVFKVKGKPNVHHEDKIWQLANNPPIPMPGQCLDG
jgi:hypothetical protein